MTKRFFAEQVRSIFGNIAFWADFLYYFVKKRGFW